MSIFGLPSARGCNEEAMPGERFCHVHRIQGSSNEATRRFMVGCLVAVILLMGSCGAFCIVAGTS